MIYQYTEQGIETSGFTGPSNVGTVNTEPSANTTTPSDGTFATPPPSFISGWPSFPMAVKIIGNKFALGSTTTPEGATPSSTETVTSSSASSQGIDIANVFISYIDLLFIGVLLLIVVVFARRK